MKQVGMPATRRFAGSVNCYVPPEVRRGIEKVQSMERKTQSEAVREILALGLQAKGIDIT